MSLETTLARTAAQRAEQDWKRHLGHCVQCTRARRQRQWRDLCEQGAPLHAEHRIRQQALEHNRALDKLPAPDQRPLF